jgi:hypothetical protein
VEERILKVYRKVLATDGRLATTDHTIRTEVERLEAEIKAARASVPSHITAYRTELGGVLRQRVQGRDPRHRPAVDRCLVWDAACRNGSGGSCARVSEMATDARIAGSDCAGFVII